jgi:hypothetical protein
MDGELIECEDCHKLASKYFDSGDNKVRCESCATKHYIETHGFPIPTITLPYRYEQYFT